VIAKADLINGWVDLLDRYQWDWFFTLTFEIPEYRGRAYRLFKEWIEFVREFQGNADFRYFPVMETGASGDNRHFHGLVGGLRTIGFRDAEHWWLTRHGTVQIEKYDPTLGAKPYILKTIRPGIDPEIDLDGLPTAPTTGR
jgi:hypothetical protein